MRTAYLLTSLIALTAATAEIFFYIDGDNHDAITKCGTDAIRRLEETASCVSFTENPGEPALAFTLIHSNECAWQPSNKTIHLSFDCITDDLCTELIGKAIGVDRPAADVAHYLGEKHNCTSPCNGLRCDHGGVLNSATCRCSCSYGFSGDKCEKLSRVDSFNDAACGVIEAEDAGSIELSTFPGDQNKGVFCQWLIQSADPWDKIELSFNSIDMDNTEMPPGQQCNDILSVYGAGAQKTIPCIDKSAEVPKMVSSSNWVLVELRTSPWARQAFPGPSIRYNLISRPTGALAFADGMTASTVVRSIIPAIAVIVARFI